jgi:poly(hydroxyalkanoate) depolymerase family esterase
MKWSRELRTARRGLRTALRAATAMMAPPAERRTVGRGGARQAVGGSGAGELVTIPDFAADPAGLSMLTYRPPGLRSRAPLVVLLHGCAQDPAAFAAGSGWMALADRVGLALVLPTQSPENNRQGCFNWFRPAQVTRGLGEAQSIRAMVAEAVRRFASDPSAVNIIGLSAGGAMAAALLAAYPDVFAGGASIAGLPVGAANGAASAIARMSQAGPSGRSPENWADQVHSAAPLGYTGPWPRLSIWQGGLDTVVDPDNARLLALQWRALHGLIGAPSVTSTHGPARREAWGPANAPPVELWTVPAMEHGYPVVDLRGQSFAVLSAGISATERIAAFCGLD